MLFLLLLATIKTSSAETTPLKTGIITAAVLNDFPPLYTRDDAGNPAGFAIDILERVATDSGLTIRYLPVENWSKAMQAVRNGEADLIPGIGISPVRSAEFTFSEKIETIPVSYFVRTSNRDILGIDSLPGHRVAVIGESAAATRLKSTPGIELVPFPDIDSALFKLMSGDVDAFAFPEPVLKRKIRMMSIESHIKVVGDPLMELKRGFLLRKTDRPLVEKINPAIREYTRSKQYLLDYQKWYGKPVPFWNLQRITWTMGVAFVIFSALLIGWRYYTINRLNRRLQQSEMQMRTLIEALPDLVWLKNTEGIYISCNRKFEQLFGAKEADIVGKTDHDFVDKKLADFFQEKDRAAMAAGKPCMNEEEVVYASDGHRELLETIKTPLLSSDGRLVGVLGVGHDITGRKQAEESLRRVQKMDALGQLTGGIAHDFNNILSIILGNLSFLERMVVDDAKATTRVKSAEKAAQRAADLTKQLLGFSSKHPKEMRPTNINLVLRGMDKLISRSITPEVEVEYNLAIDLWLTEIDPSDFEDALLNLILNARDAMPDGGRLTIETSNKTLDATYAKKEQMVVPGEYIELAVSDSGHGISKDDLDHIFEPFYTTKPHGKGAGLGLSMVFGFTRRAKGYIKVYSEPGIGTTMRCYLPRSVEITEYEEIASTENTQLPHGRETILVVDDEEDLIELAQDCLEELGYTVVTATSGIQAMKVLAENPSIELLFSDIVMPGGMNGYELAEQAEASYPGIKVLLTSGYTGKSVAHNGQARFAAEILSKPHTVAELAQRVRKILDGVGGDETV